MLLNEEDQPGGSVISQDVEALRVDIARSLFGVDGSGVTIGIMSDSFDTAFDDVDGGGYAADIASGDLPPGIVVLDDHFPEEAFNPFWIGDEGRAMAQLIHDIAPGAELIFATAFEGQDDYAENVQALVDAGADIIVDDVWYSREPYYADGVVAQAFSSAVEQGVAVFSSAGNNGDDGVTEAFRSSGVEGVYGELHDWDPGPGFDRDFDITVDAGDTFRAILHWLEPYGSTSFLSPGSSSDLDMVVTLNDEIYTIGELFDDFGDRLEENRFELELYYGPLEAADRSAPAFRSSFNNIGEDPSASFRVVNPLEEPREYGFEIHLDGGEAPEEFILFFSGLRDGLRFNAVDRPELIGEPTNFGHTTAPGVIGVGGAFFFDTPAFGPSIPELTWYSSLGGIEIYFDEFGNRLETPEVRQGVDITASHGGNTTFFGFESSRDDDDFPNFFGTSAAAPNAAAIAALMLQANPDLTPGDIERLLEDTAIDMDNPFTDGFDIGDDAGSGAGLIQADLAVAAALASGDDDVIVGDEGDDTIRTLRGEDLIVGLGGDDVIDGGRDNDDIRGGAGDDRLIGARGSDRVEGGVGDDRVIGGADDDVLFGNAGDDWLDGGAGDDRLEGGGADDTLNAGGGNDFARGGDGDDLVIGGAGDDRAIGGFGNDRLIGGAGSDRMIGRNGNDVFVFRDADASDGVRDFDVIVDFEFGVDALALKDLSIVSLSQVGNGVRAELSGDDRDILKFVGRTVDEVEMLL